jgi:hypothetical protein
MGRLPATIGFDGLRSCFLQALGITLARLPGLSRPNQQKRPVNSIRSKPLIVAALVISIAIAILSLLGHYGLGSLQTQQIEGFSAFGLNTAVAILGLWTPHRATWAGYLGISVLAFLLLSVATPLNGLWVLMVVAFDWLSNG